MSYNMPDGYRENEMDDLYDDRANPFELEAKIEVVVDIVKDLIDEIENAPSWNMKSVLFDLQRIEKILEG